MAHYIYMSEKFATFGKISDPQMAPALIITTSAFPYGGLTEQSFLLPELEPLARQFGRVVIVPQLLETEAPACPLPEGVETDTRFARSSAASGKALRHLRSLLHRRFAAAAIHAGVNLLHPRRLRALAAYFAGAREFAAFVRRNYPPSRGYRYYTFWFDHTATAFALLREAEGACIVSRAHGYDIFDHRVAYRSRYLRRLTLRRLTALFPQSLDGELYLKRHYPASADKITTQLLGCVRLYPEANPDEAPDDEFTIATVARLHPVKRLPQTVGLLCRLAANHPDRRFRWILIGEGPDRTAIEAEARKAPANLTIEMRGQMANADVQRLYATRHVDLFLLLSSSETSSIALCEALAYGIPALTAHVGGLPAILGATAPGFPAETSVCSDSSTNATPCCGITVDPSLAPDAFLAAATGIIESAPLRQNLRAAARTTWESNLDATRLRPAFASHLSRL